MHFDTHQTVGTSMGAVFAAVNTFLQSSSLTWTSIFETTILAALGAAVGFFVTNALRWLKKKIS